MPKTQEPMTYFETATIETVFRKEKPTPLIHVVILGSS